MKLTDEDRRDIRYGSAVARSTGWRVGVAALVVVLAGLALGGILWGISVATSGPKGAGDVVRKGNDATNRIGAQQRYQQEYNQILAYDRELDQAAADKAAHPGDQYFATNYSGMVKACLDAVGQYDADTQKVTQQQWRDVTLPFQIDTTAPTTDCKETLK